MSGDLPTAATRPRMAREVMVDRGSNEVVAFVAAKARAFGDARALERARARGD